MEIINSNTKGINQAVKKILEGEIFFIPTDTVYGIAANPYNNEAIKNANDWGIDIPIIKK